MDETALKDLLLKENAEFQKLHLEHQACENRLSAFIEKPYLSDGESLEAKDLKKKKLALKDRMYDIMKDFQKTL